ncbi:hypothetical protein BsWGS_15411 [Bradybaena similaris]
MDTVQYGSMKRTVSSRNINCIKCGLVGDGMVGKTSLLYSYTHRVFIQKYTATVLEKYIVPMMIGEEQVLLTVYDTAGQNDFEEFRVDPYLECDVIILCFSVSDVESFSNILHVWMPEIRQHIKRKVSLILVGTQTDLRGSVRPTVMPDEGLRMAKLINAEAYVECSASSGVGLDNLFRRVIESTPRISKRKNSFLNRLLKR